VAITAERTLGSWSSSPGGTMSVWCRRSRWRSMPTTCFGLVQQLWPRLRGASRRRTTPTSRIDFESIGPGWMSCQSTIARWTSGLPRAPCSGIPRRQRLAAFTAMECGGSCEAIGCRRLKVYPCFAEDRYPCSKETNSGAGLSISVQESARS